MATTVGRRRKFLKIIFSEITYTRISSIFWIFPKIFPKKLPLQNYRGKFELSDMSIYFMDPDFSNIFWKIPGISLNILEDDLNLISILKLHNPHSKTLFQRNSIGFESWKFLKKILIQHSTISVFCLKARWIIRKSSD